MISRHAAESRDIAAQSAEDPSKDHRPGATPGADGGSQALPDLIPGYEVARGLLDVQP
jgi:hypothetical protein